MRTRCCVMKSYTQTGFQALFLVAFVWCFAMWQHHDNQWDYLMFTQQWPAAACVDINNTHKETCLLTSNIKTWTVHGIWPSKLSGDGPFYCNNSAPFVEASITDLEPQMLDRWPNLIQGEGKTSFWKHEWVKHGTCAMSLPALDTEHKYFDKALNLNLRFNFTLALSSRNITPSSTARYKLSDMREAIEATVGAKIKMQCIFAKNPKEQALIQVELCMDKAFKTQDCSSGTERSTPPKWDTLPYNPAFEPCQESLDTQYIPFVYAT